MAAAISIAQEMDEDQILLVQETEYTGAGKHQAAQLTFAKDNGIKVKRGNPREEVAGESIVIPEHPKQIQAQDLDLNDLKRSYIKNIIQRNDPASLSEKDIEYLVEETKSDPDYIRKMIGMMSK